MNDETKEVIKEVIKQINELAPYKIVLSEDAVSIGKLFWNVRLSRDSGAIR